MTKLKIVTEKEVALLCRLAKEIWEEHYVKMIGQAQVDFMLEKFHSKEIILTGINQGDLWAILWENENPLGYLMLQLSTDKIYLSKIYLKKASRGKAYGKLMMDFVKDYAIEKGKSAIYLNVNKQNTASIAFYEKYGFTKSGEGVFEIGNGFVMDDFIYELKLD